MYLLLWALVSALIVLLDFITKRIVSGSMYLYESIPVIENVFNITYVKNTGASFGMMSGARWFFVAVTVILIGAVVFYTVKNKVRNKLFLLSTSFVVGGGIGNLIDRIATGEVVDFFDFCLINFAIFNVADCFVVVGVILIVLYYILDDIKKHKEKGKA